MRAREGRSGKVRVQDTEACRVGIVALDEPSEAWAEEGGGSRNERLAEGSEGGEGVVDGAEEVFRAGLRGALRVRCQGAEHEVIVEGHGGVVEEGGFLGEARILDYEVFSFATFVGTS